MKHITFILLFIVSSFAISSPLLDLQKYYLGKEPVGEITRSLIDKYAKAAGIKETIPVFKLSPASIVKKIINDCAGFTTISGIWIDEQLLQEIPAAEAAFICAHEVAHYKLRHPTQFLVFDSVIIAGASLLTTKLFFWSLEKYNSLGKAAIPSLGFLAVSQIPLVLFCKNTEKKADLYAAELMFAAQDYDLLLEYFNYILSLDGSGYVKNDWMHPSLKEEIVYLKKILENKIR